MLVLLLLLSASWLRASASEVKQSGWVERDTTGCVDAQKVLDLETQKVALEYEREALAKNVETLTRRIAELERRDNDLSANLGQMARQVGTLHARNMALITQNRDLELSNRRLQEERAMAEHPGSHEAKYNKLMTVGFVLVAASTALSCWLRKRAVQRAPSRVGGARELDLGSPTASLTEHHQSNEDPSSSSRVSEAVSLPLLASGAEALSSEGHSHSSAAKACLRHTTSSPSQPLAEHLGFEEDLE